MKDILWTAYLAVMILVSIYTAVFFADSIKKEDITKLDSRIMLAMAISCSIGWSYWYMYFLH